MSFLISVINGKQPSGGTGGVSDADFSHLDVDFMQAGVLSTGDLAVTQQVTPDMTVAVAAGVAYIANSAETMLYRSKLSPAANVTIGSNASGNPRKDAIVVKLDLAATPDKDGDGVASLVAVQGTPAVSPTNPTDNDIQTAIGSGNAFLRLANVLVDNGAVSITTAKISDARTVVGFNMPSAGSLNDTNGNELVKFPSVVASAVNEVTVTNAATGNSPQVSSTGGDSNVGLDMKMKGTGRYRRPTIVEIPVGSSSTSLATGDGQAFFRVPDELNGMNLTGVAAALYTAGTTGTCDIQIRNKTQAADMLTTKLTIDSAETDTATAATAAVIDTANDDVATGDIIAIDIDAVQTTAPKGLVVQMRFELP